MAKTVSAAFAKANFGSLLDQVEKGGERISITRYNRVIAEIGAPAENRGVPKFGTGKGKVKILDPNWADPLSAEEMKAWTG
jgi:antitoxin (DNA-binding transcriptional repressor) of toxin-antitoxin stability system